jgi:hypothetical protein
MIVAASELGEDQVFVQTKEATVPVHDDGGPLDTQGLVDHDLHYIIKIPAHY